MLLESSSLPIPSEVILPFAGYLVSLGRLNFALIILVSTLAGISGSLVDYYIGKKGRNLLARRKALASYFSMKHACKRPRGGSVNMDSMVLLSRMVPGFRTLVSFPAGAVKMPLAKFIAYTIAGCLCWNALLTFIGVYVGANWPEVAGISHYLIIGFLAVILAAFIVFLLGEKKERRLGSEGKSFIQTKTHDDALLWKKAVVGRAVYSVQSIELDLCLQKGRYTEFRA